MDQEAGNIRMKEAPPSMIRAFLGIRGSYLSGVNNRTRSVGNEYSASQPVRKIHASPGQEPARARIEQVI